jgi:hypothetical protein
LGRTTNNLIPTLSFLKNRCSPDCYTICGKRGQLPGETPVSIQRNISPVFTVQSQSCRRTGTAPGIFSFLKNLAGEQPAGGDRSKAVRSREPEEISYSPIAPASSPDQETIQLPDKL